MTFVERGADQYEDVVAAETSSVVLASGSGPGLFYPQDSAVLRRRPLDARVSDEEFRIPAFLRDWSLSFLVQQREATFFNGQVVGLGAFHVGGMASADQVLFRTCAYFDFLATNILARHDVEDDRGTLLDGRRLFVDRFDRLRTLDSSKLANVVGVSTLAFSEDGKLLVVRQTRANVGSPGLGAPSGSGALEPRDLTRADDEPLTLGGVVCRGVARELSEECNVQPEEIESTHLMGYGRWLARGAMPEFSSLSFVRGEGAALASRRVRPGERAYVNGVRAIRLRPFAFWDPGDPLSPLPDGEHEKASFPLVLALAALIHALHDQGWEPGKELCRRMER